MELRHIRYFLTVAEEKNFTKAAEKLMIAQPPLSRQIKDLEEELGTELFRRSSKGVELTPAGKKFEQYALQMETLAVKSKEAIMEMTDGLQGTLFLATVEGKAPQLLAEFISDFHKEYPHVEFNLWNGNSDDVLERLKSSLCDLAIVMGPFDDEGIDKISLFREPWIAMIPVEHELAAKCARKDTVSVEELIPYELIIPSKRSRLQEISRWFSKYDASPKVVARLAHVLDAYELAAQNVGISIYPNAAEKYVDPTKVLIKKLKNPEVYAEYYLVKLSERNLSGVAQTFWNRIAQKEKN